MAVNAISYVRNVGRSLGYTAIDVFNEMNPTIKSLADTNKELGEQLYNTIKDIKGVSNRAAKKALSSDVADAASDAIHNIISDIKSGNYYNKERISAREEEMFGGSFDFDDDFDFDDGEAGFDSSIDDGFDFDEGFDSLEGTMDTVGEKVANAVSLATAQSAEYIVRNQKQASSILYNQNAEIYKGITTGLSAINANLVGIGELSQNLNAHMQNASVFYTRATENLNKQTELLQQIANNTAPKSVMSEGRKGSGRTTINDLLGENDVLDFGAFFKNMKDNISDMMSMVTGYGDMFKDENGKGGNFFKAFTASPLQFVLNNMMKAMTPKMIQDTTRQFNESLSGFFGSLLMKINDQAGNWDLGPIASKIFEVMGFDNKFNTKIDTSRYEKGKVDFDGITRKSIVEVIPTYLAKILSAMNGQGETRFDYESGKFVSTKDIKKMRDNEIRRESNSAGIDIESEFRDRYKNRSDYASMESNLREFFKKAMESGTMFNYRTANEDEYSRYNLDKDTGDALVDMLKSLESTNAALVQNFNKNILTGRQSTTDRFNRLSQSGTSVMGNLYNNSISDKNSLGSSPLNIVNMRDEKNNNIFFYLQGIYQYTQHVSDNLENIAGGGDGNNNRRRRGNNRSRAMQGVREIATTVLEQPEETITPDASVMDSLDYDRLIAGLEESPVIVDYQEYLNMDQRERDRYLTKVTDEKRKSDARKENSKKGVVQKLVDSGMVHGALANLLTQVSGIMNKPAEMVSNVLHSADKKLLDIIYGTDKDNEDGGKGFLAVTLEKVKETFGNMNNWLNEHILNPLADKLDIHSAGDVAKKIMGIFGVDADALSAELKNIKDDIISKLFGDKTEDGKREGGVFSEVTNKVKENLSNVKDWMKDAYGSTIGKVFKFGRGNNEESDAQAASGGMVSKTGMVAVSEGELIIPSEYNPFYKGKTNKKLQRLKESSIISKFYGSYADGGTAGQGAATEEETSYFERIRNAARSAAGTEEDPTLLRESVASLKEGIHKVFDRLFGGDKESEELKSKVSNVTSKALKEMAVPDNISGMLTGALLGGGAAILSGGLLTPMMGAAIGSAGGLVMKSKVVQDALFGNVEEGKEGLLPKQISDFIQNKLPTMGKFGFVGATASLLPFIPGGPVTGLVLGSAIGYATQSERIKEAIFGTKDGEDGFISKEIQDRVKKAMPRMGAGAIAGILAGPFGIVGNITVGAALGYASTSDRFQRTIFGENDDGEGGLIGWIKESIFQPVRDAIQPIAKEIQVKAKGMVKSFSRMLYNMFKETLGIPLFKKLNDMILKPLQNIFGKMVSPLKTVISAPFKLVGKVGDHLRKKQIQGGTATYMTAQERLNYRSEKGMRQRGSSFEFDTAVAGMDQDQLQDLRNYVGAIQNPDRDIQRKANDTLHGLSSDLSEGDNLSYKQVKKIMKAIQNQDPDKAMRELDRATGLDSATRQSLQQRITQASTEFNQLKSQQGDVTSYTQQQIQEIKDKFGIDINDKNAWKYEDLLKGEMKARKKQDANRTPEEIALQQEQTNHVEIIDRVDMIIERLKILTGEARSPIESDSTTTDTDVTGTAGVNVAVEAAQAVAAQVADPDADKTERYTTTSDGATIKQIRNTQGDWIADMSDKETKAIIDRQTDLGDAQIKTANAVSGLKGTIMGALGSIFGNDDEEKPTTLFGFLKNIMGNVFGESGLIGKFLLGGGVKSLLGILGTALSAAFTTWLTKESILRILGWKDGGEDANETTTGENVLNTVMETVANNPNGEEPDTARDKNYYADRQTAKVTIDGVIYEVMVDKDGMAMKDANGNYIGADGSIIQASADSWITYKDTGPSFSDRARYDTVRSVATGRPSLVSRLVRKQVNRVSKAGTSIKNSINRITGRGAASAADDVAEAAANTAVQSADDITRSLTNASTDALHEAAEGAASTAASSADDVIESATRSLSGSVDDVAESAATTAARSVASGADDAVEAAARGATGAAEAAASSGLLNSVLTMVHKALDKIPAFLAKVPILNKFAGSADDVVKLLANNIDDAVKAAGSKLASLASTLSTAVPFIKIAFMVADFYSGYQDARTTLGIVEEPTLGQRIISGLLRMIKNLIPIIGALIPDNFLVDLFVGQIAPIMGIDVDEISEQQLEAKATVEEYNTAHGTDYSIRDYNKEVLGDYTTGEKIGNAFSTVKNNIKEKGVIGAAGSALSSAGNAIANSKAGKAVSGAIDTVKSGASALGEKIGGAVKGVKNNIVAAAQAASKIWSNALSGDPEKFNEKMEASEDDEDVSSVYLGIVNKVNKVLSTPLFMISMVAHKIKDFIGGIVDSVKHTLNNIKLAGQDTVAALSSGGTFEDWLDVSKYEDKEGNPVSGISKGILIASRVALTAFFIARKIGQTIADAIGKVITTIKTNLSTAVGSMTQIGSMAIKGDFEAYQAFEPVFDENDPTNGFQKAIVTVAKIGLTPLAAVASVGKKIIEVVKGVIDTAKRNIVTAAGSMAQIGSMAAQGDFAAYQAFEPVFDENDPTNAFQKAIVNIAKIGYTPLAAISSLGKKIKDFITDKINIVKANFNRAKESVGEIGALAFSGEFDKMKEYEPEFEDGDPTNGFQKMVVNVAKIGLTPIAAVISLGNKIKDFITDKINTIKANFNRAKESVIELATIASEGDVDKLQEYDPEFEEGDPTNGFQNAVINIAKVILTPITATINVGKTIKKKFDELKTNLSEAVTIGDTFDTIKDKATEDGVNFNEYWSLKSTVKDSNPFKPINSVIMFMGKLLFSPMFLINKVMEKVAGVVDNIKNKISDTWSSFTGWLGLDDDGGGSEVNDEESEAVDAALKKKKKKKSKVKTTAPTGTKSETKTASAKGSGFISQTDANYKNQPYGSSTVGEDGCGPAAAAMAVNSAYGTGNVVSMKDTLAYARRNGYETSGGTSADYFGDVFNQYGMNAQYVSNTGSGAQSNMMANISNGNPTVLLGQDTSNKSKSKSPFGPGNHYVVATGTDRNGNIIVNDPEATGSKVYSRNILSKVKLGVTGSPAGGSSRIKNKLRGFRVLFGGDSSANKAAVWQFLKSKGCSDEVAAGIIGNIMQESTCNPSAIESNGEGHGLVQWSYDRKQRLFDRAKAAGVDWSNMDLQLNLLWEEMNSLDTIFVNASNKKYGSVQNFCNINNVDEACTFFCTEFERAGKPESSNRLQYARDAYQEFTGKYPTGSFDGSTSAVSSDGTSSSTDTGLSSLSGLFSNAVSAFYGDDIGSLFGLSSSSSSTSTTDTGTTALNTNASALGKQIAKDAIDYVGKIPYVWGGTDLNSGVDCSGFTQQIMAKNGITIPRTAAAQAASAEVGATIDPSNALPGDLVYFQNTGDRTGVTHTGIMIGNDDFVHAQSSKTGIIQTSLSGSSYANKLYGIRRPQALQGAGSGLGYAPIMSMTGSGSGMMVDEVTMRKQQAVKQKARGALKAIGKLNGGGDDSTMVGLIKSIITILTTMMNNSNQLNTIVSLLSNYFSAKESTSTKTSNATTSNTSSANSTNTGVDDATKELVEYLNTLASGY